MSSGNLPPGTFGSQAPCHIGILSKPTAEGLDRKTLGLDPARLCLGWVKRKESQELVGGHWVQKSESRPIVSDKGKAKPNQINGVDFHRNTPFLDLNPEPLHGSGYGSQEKKIPIPKISVGLSLQKSWSPPGSEIGISTHKPRQISVAKIKIIKQSPFLSIF